MIITYPRWWSESCASAAVSARLLRRHLGLQLLQPDPLRLSVPKAFAVLRPGVEESPEMARSIREFCKAKLASYKRVLQALFTRM